MKINFKILQTIYKFPYITVSLLVYTTKQTKDYTLEQLEYLLDKKIITSFYLTNNTLCFQITELGKTIYFQSKITSLLKTGIIIETDSLAPCVCEGCIYYIQNFTTLCDNIKCDSNKIFILNKKN